MLSWPPSSRIRLSSLKGLIRVSVVSEFLQSAPHDSSVMSGTFKDSENFPSYSFIVNVLTTSPPKISDRNAMIAPC